MFLQTELLYVGSISLLLSAFQVGPHVFLLLHAQLLCPNAWLCLAMYAAAQEDLTTICVPHLDVVLPCAALQNDLAKICVPLHVEEYDLPPGYEDNNHARLRALLARGVSLANGARRFLWSASAEHAHGHPAQSCCSTQHSPAALPTIHSLTPQLHACVTDAAER